MKTTLARSSSHFRSTSEIAACVVLQVAPAVESPSNPFCLAVKPPRAAGRRATVCTIEHARSLHGFIVYSWTSHRMPTQHLIIHIKLPFGSRGSGSSRVRQGISTRIIRCSTYSIQRHRWAQDILFVSWFRFLARLHLSTIYLLM